MGGQKYQAKAGPKRRRIALHVFGFRVINVSTAIGIAAKENTEDERIYD